MSDETKERPILFSGAMVRALLAGTKTMTRRAVAPGNSTIGSLPMRDWPLLDFDAPGVFADGKGAPSMFMPIAGCEYLHVPHSAAAGEVMHETRHRVYARWMPGDVLWVRETWSCLDSKVRPGSRVAYRADTADGERVRVDAPWRPSIHMPRWASRLSLRVTSVRVERLQDISEADARAEGVTPRLDISPDQPIAADVHGRTFGSHPYTAAYAMLWDSLNGPGAWASSPWVWVVSFRRD